MVETGGYLKSFIAIIHKLAKVTQQHNWQVL
jgi:hypothetical protein